MENQVRGLMHKISESVLLFCGRRSRYLKFVLIFVATIGFLLSSLVYIGSVKGDSNDRFLVVGFFVLPVFVQIFILVTLRSQVLRGVFSAAMSISLFSYLIPWVLYSFGIFGYGAWACCFLAACFPFALAVWVTWLIMARPVRRLGVNDNPVESFQRAISRNIFKAICFFLSLFLCVTYSLAVAFGVHDKDQRARGDFALCVTPDPERASSGGRDILRERILFRSGLAQVEARSAEDSRRVASGDDATMLHRNYDRLAHIKSYFEPSGDGRYRVTLIGHTDDTDIRDDSKGYRSNFELSQARAFGVYMRLTNGGLVNWHNVTQWTMVPMANVDDYVTASSREKLERRSVEVVIEPDGLTIGPEGARGINTCKRSGVSLHDYIYFTIYTITTTGYGDIRPITGGAKMMSSVANYFELFFIVIFLMF